ncbi:MAG: DUF3887 domain-containing protein [Clostridiales bacterium]|uniref:DUF3887 domain-containing protein n=1 Tax=Clostridium sp. N3C TaxID=1776758 RepID=UPI00094336F1|nr:DUF3887 domain-containing protein [Clostridium sp. N3C]NLZ48330.1 DUF3887 domain-containing protein [Clostridiales bacterium]
MSKKYCIVMAYGDFDSISNNFSHELKKALTKQELKKAWNSTVEGVGYYIDINSVKEEGNNVQVILEY